MPNLPATTDNPRQDKLIGLLLTDNDNTPMPTLAQQAGYSKAYANTTLYNTIKTDTFQRKLINAYKASTTTQLPRLIRIQDNALKEYEKDSLLAINKPGMIQNLQRVTGVVQDEAKAPQTVNINNLTIAQNVLEQHFEAQDDKD